MTSLLIPLEIKYLIICITGMFLWFIIQLRRINRRGAGGMQHFRHPVEAMLIIFIEYLLAWIGFILMIYGGIGYVMN